MTDAELVRQVQQGDAEAYAQLVNRYRLGDNQATYFQTGRGEEWLASVEALWQTLGKRDKRKLWSEYLPLTIEGHFRVGHYSVALDLARKKLAHLRRVVAEPMRSSVIAQTYAANVARAYQSLGRTRQMKRALDVATPQSALSVFLVVTAKF